MIDKPLSFIGDDHGDSDDEIVLLGTMKTTGSNVQKLLISNVAIASADDLLPALQIADGAGAVFVLDCQIIGSSNAISIGCHTMGVNFIYNDISAEGDCILCQPHNGQIPVIPMTLVCNSFMGASVIQAQGFPVIASSNILNNMSVYAIGN